MMAELQIHA